MSNSLQDRLHVCARCVWGAGKPGVFSPHVPVLAKLEVTAFRYEYARAPMGSPPGVAGVSGSGWDLQLCLSLPSAAQELLPACACQVVVCNHLSSPCSRDSEVPERAETTPAWPSRLYGQTCSSAAHR